MPFSDSGKLKLALPNKGRLREPSIALLKRSGYSFRAKERALYATCTNDHIVFVFIRTDDISVLVSKGIVDLGITGTDIVEEKKSTVDEILPLGFGECRLCVAGPDNVHIRGEGETSLDFLKGKVIATSFPEITYNFFKKRGIDVECVELSGSVEIMISLGLADAIVDIVETGDSLRANGLKVYETIGRYHTALIANPAVKDDPRVSQIRRRFEGLLIADKYSLLEYNIAEKNLKKGEGITPGFESPTISSLEEKGWVSVKVMVKKKEVVSAMDKLESVGATAIMETSINNCRL